MPTSKTLPHRDPMFFVALVVLSLITRLVWVLWVHPPEDYVFSDMARYIERAREAAAHPFSHGYMGGAWQAFGTHVLLALPLALPAAYGLRAAAVLWALMSAASVPVGYRLGTRLFARRWQQRTLGMALLLWHPHLSNAGYFLSETPFLLAALVSTLSLVLLVQEGRCAWLAGVSAALVFALRPQSALFYAGAFVWWWLKRASLPKVTLRHMGVVGACLAAMLGLSLLRFYAHTGYCCGIAENANMNLTAARCHNVITEAFANERELQRAQRDPSTTRRHGRWVSLPGFRTLADLPNNSFFALRPALGERLQFVGRIGDPTVHRALRKRCLAATGVLGQVRYSLVNVALLWWYSRPWPEQERGRATFLAPVAWFQRLFPWVIALPSFAGMVIVLRRGNPAWMLVALQLLSMVAIAAVFFGEFRLRLPYDPYAIMLALVFYTWAVSVVTRRFRGGQ